MVELQVLPPKTYVRILPSSIRKRLSSTPFTVAFSSVFPTLSRVELGETKKSPSHLRGGNEKGSFLKVILRDFLNRLRIIAGALEYSGAPSQSRHRTLKCADSALSAGGILTLPALVPPRSIRAAAGSRVRVSFSLPNAR